MSIARGGLRVQDIQSLQDDMVDSEDLKHNCHSDADIDLDSDPWFEYNKCHAHSFIEKRLEDRIYNFEPI